MRRLFVAVGGSAMTGLVAAGIALAHGPGQPVAAMGPAMDMHGGSRAGLSIVHVARGCHMWSNGKGMAAVVNLTMPRNGRLAIDNRDLDGHRLIQTKGPKVAIARPALKMNQSTVLVFRKPGLYRFKTVSFELPGMPEIKTQGPDHALFLIVRAK